MTQPGAVFVDARGEQHEENLDVSIYREATAKNLSVRQLLNQKYPTAVDGPDAFTQMCASAGLFFKEDRKNGITAPSLAQVLDAPVMNAAGTIVRDASPASRILFPAAVLQYVESRLQRDYTTGPNAFDNAVAVSQTVANNRTQQPVIKYTDTSGPESGVRAQRISQLDSPTTMLTITASDIVRKIPTTSIGLEISREAMQAFTLDLVGMTLVRFFAIERYNVLNDNLLGFLQGDADSVVTPMSANTSALAQVKANSLDSTISAAGTLTQKAWLLWLYRNIIYRRLDWIVTDIAGLMAIENRTGRPTNVMNNSTDRIDRAFKVTYPEMQDTPINVFVVDPSVGWPANTIMGFMSSGAIMKITNSLADYAAVEEFVLQKKTGMRYDTGVLYSRLYDEAFDTLSLTL